MPDQRKTSLSRIKTWNRRIHICIGLYMLLFLWVFCVSGLFMNHPGWFTSQPQRSSVTQKVNVTGAGTNLDKAHDLMHQLKLTGEVVFRGDMPVGKFVFMALRPNVRQFINVDLATSEATVRSVELGTAGVLGELHTFSGVRGIYREHESTRDWLPTRVWSFSMDALAVGILLLVASSLYMAWQRLRSDRWGVLLSLAAGIAAVCYFMWALAWLG